MDFHSGRSYDHGASYNLFGDGNGGYSIVAVGYVRGEPAQGSAMLAQEENSTEIVVAFIPPDSLDVENVLVLTDMQAAMRIYALRLCGLR